MRDDTVPGHSTLSDWERPPVGALQPVVLREEEGIFERIRTTSWDAMDLTFTLIDASGHRYRFFFDGFLGRLCAGQDREDEQAAFVAPDSPVLHTVLDVLEAHRDLDRSIPEALEKARHYGRGR